MLTWKPLAVFALLLGGLLWLRWHDVGVRAEARARFTADSLTTAREAFYRGVRLHDSVAQATVDSLKRSARAAAQQADLAQAAFDSMVTNVHAIHGQFVPIADVRAFVDTANAVIFALRTAYRRQGLALQFATVRADSLAAALTFAQALQTATETQWRAAIRRAHPPLFSLRRLRPSVNAGCGFRGCDVQVGVSYQF